MPDKLIKVLLDDIKEHVDKLRDLSEVENPDGEQVEYHHGAFERKFNLLKEAVSLGS